MRWVQLCAVIAVNWGSVVGLDSGRQAVWRLWCNLVGVVKLLVALTRSFWVL